MAQLALFAHSRYAAFWAPLLLATATLAAVVVVGNGPAGAQDQAPSDRGERSGTPVPLPAQPGSDAGSPTDTPTDDGPDRPVIRRESPLITRLREATPLADQLEASWTVTTGPIDDVRDRIRTERQLALDAVTTWLRRAPGRLLEATATALVFETADGFVTWHLDSRQTGSARSEALAAIGLRIPRPAITSVSGHRLRAMRPLGDGDPDRHPVRGNPDLLWEVSLPTPITGVQLAPGLVIARTTAQQVFVLHAASGRVLGRIELTDEAARVVPVRGGVLMVDDDRVRRLDLIRMEGLQLMREQWQEQLVSGGGEAEPRDLVLRLVHTDTDWERERLIQRILAAPGDRMDVYLVDELQQHLDAFELDAAELRLVRLLDEVLVRRGKHVGHGRIRAALARELRTVGLLDTPHAPFNPESVTADQMERLQALAGLIAPRHDPGDMELMVELLEFPLDRFYVAPFQSVVLAYIERMPREQARPAFKELLLQRATTAPFRKFSVDDLRGLLARARVRALDRAVVIRLDTDQPIWTDDDFATLDRLLGALTDAEGDLAVVRQRARSQGTASAARLAVALRAATSRVERVHGMVESLGSALTVLQSARHTLLHSDDDRLQEPIRTVLDENWDYLYRRLLEAADDLESLEARDCEQLLTQMVEFRQRIERLEIKGVVDHLR